MNITRRRKFTKQVGSTNNNSFVGNSSNKCYVLLRGMISLVSINLNHNPEISSPIASYNFKRRNSAKFLEELEQRKLSLYNNKILKVGEFFGNKEMKTNGKR